MKRKRGTGISISITTRKTQWARATTLEAAAGIIGKYWGTFLPCELNFAKLL